MTTLPDTKWSDSSFNSSTTNTSRFWPNSHPTSPATAETRFDLLRREHYSVFSLNHVLTCVEKKKEHRNTCINNIHSLFNLPARCKHSRASKIPMKTSRDSPPIRSYAQQRLWAARASDGTDWGLQAGSRNPTQTKAKWNKLARRVKCDATQGTWNHWKAQCQSCMWDDHRSRGRWLWQGCKEAWLRSTLWK